MISPKIDLLLDLAEQTGDSQSLESFVANLQSEYSLGKFVERATLILPASLQVDQGSLLPEWVLVQDSNRIRLANSALVSARDSNRHLLVLLHPWHITNESAGVLADAFGLDDHFGISVPRQTSSSGRIMPLKGVDVQSTQDFPRRLLAEIPDHYVVPEFQTSCFLILNKLLNALGLLEETCDNLSGAFYRYSCQARRTGFRTVVVNRAVVASLAFESARSESLISKKDLRRLHSEYPDAGRAKAEFARLPIHDYEELLGLLFSTDLSRSKSILIDLRGVPNYFNGTAEAALSLCDAFSHEDCEWNITLLAEPATAEYHDLRRRYHKWKFLTAIGTGKFVIALRPSQPWHLDTLVELHRIALLNFYGLLDTIAWDIMFEAPRGLTACWNFMAEYGDGILYNSTYTREHFVRRFPLAQSVPDFVFHHSLSPRDYASQLEPRGNNQDYWLLIGNQYEHKALNTTVDLLVSSFPFQQLRVLGLKSHENPQVQTIESGRVDSHEIEHLFADASLIIFPSLYEGFGLPVVKGLSYGRTVVARQSDLLLEIAAHYRGPGRIISFSNPYELVDRLGRITHDLEVEEVPLSNALLSGAEPLNWLTIAQRTLAFLTDRLRHTSEFRWRARERAVQYLDAYRS